MEKTEKPIPCFFCGEKSDSTSAFPVSLCKVIKEKGSRALQDVAIETFGALGVFVGGKTFFFIKRIVQVPRCPRCKALHDTRNSAEGRFIEKGALFGAIVGVAAGIYVAFLYYGKHKGLGGAIFTAVLVTIFGLMICTFLAWIFSFLAHPKLPSHVKSTTKAEKLASIQQMLEGGWQVGEKPMGPGGANFFEIPKEKKEEFLAAIEKT